MVLGGPLTFTVSPRRILRSDECLKSDMRCKSFALLLLGISVPAWRRRWLRRSRNSYLVYAGGGGAIAATC